MLGPHDSFVKRQQKKFEEQLIYVFYGQYGRREIEDRLRTRSSLIKG